MLCGTLPRCLIAASRSTVTSYVVPVNDGAIGYVALQLDASVPRPMLTALLCCNRQRRNLRRRVLKARITLEVERQRQAAAHEQGRSDDDDLLQRPPTPKFMNEQDDGSMASPSLSRASSPQSASSRRNSLSHSMSNTLTGILGASRAPSPIPEEDSEQPPSPRQRDAASKASPAASPNKQVEQNDREAPALTEDLQHVVNEGIMGHHDSDEEVRSPPTLLILCAATHSPPRCARCRSKCWRTWQLQTTPRQRTVSQDPTTFP